MESKDNRNIDKETTYKNNSILPLTHLDERQKQQLTYFLRIPITSRTIENISNISSARTANPSVEWPYMALSPNWLSIVRMLVQAMKKGQNTTLSIDAQMQLMATNIQNDFLRWPRMQRKENSAGTNPNRTDFASFFRSMTSNKSLKSLLLLAFQCFFRLTSVRVSGIFKDTFTTNIMNRIRSPITTGSHIICRASDFTPMQSRHARVQYLMITNRKNTKATSTMGKFPVIRVYVRSITSYVGSLYFLIYSSLLNFLEALSFGAFLAEPIIDSTAVLRPSFSPVSSSFISKRSSLFFLEITAVISRSIPRSVQSSSLTLEGFPMKLLLNRARYLPMKVSRSPRL